MSDMPLALVGADTFTGEAILNLLSEAGVKAEQVVALSDEASDDASVQLGGQTLPVMNLDRYAFSAGQLVICAENAALAEATIAKAGSAGAMVIDATAFSRSQEYLSLIHPDMNPEALMNLQQQGVVAVPGDIAVSVVPVLRALKQLGGVGRVDLSCLLSVSSAGKDGVSELATQTSRLLNGLPAEHSTFADQVAFNILPGAAPATSGVDSAAREINALLSDGSYQDESSLPVHINSVVAPVFYGQTIHLSVSMDWEVSVAEVMDVLEGDPSLLLSYDPEEMMSPVSLANAEDGQKNRIQVCGMNVSENQGYVLNMWLVTDNARVGSSSAVVQLYRKLIADFL
ncbi:hypothetical protein M3P05_01795 [Sansalvadorimonas sp. 2012CJ34-2]|uniref:Semialdehyde dehydrogenase NAD-binding domain-containing protein n=1 Tax=Parendozoicomonas callyspongiae TaxID=2942213 RepID=A0ABT0PBR1_9GAMM|nr:Asd/ArgC dimerization domain-containing protein [Sansalvadorimonas sp. 2012CJ34-2]MCL6268686.1 hypothetical protein [Sansalvadorimonas sp. 2012CJ34-2]